MIVRIEENGCSWRLMISVLAIPRCTISNVSLIHNLKIDRTFIEGFAERWDDAAIAEVIIAMAKKLA